MAKDCRDIANSEHRSALKAKAVTLIDTSGSEINPATEDTLSTLNNKLLTEDGHIKVIGYHESIGHLSTNGALSVERAIGNKTGIGTGAFTLLESHPFVQPPETPGDVIMYVQSDNVADSDSLGTGSREITCLYYSKSWGVRKTVTTILDGTTQVVISGGTDKYRLHKVYINKGVSAIGNITITNAAQTILYGQIDQYETTMERAIFYVAENEKVTVTEGFLGTTTSGGIIARLFASEEDINGNVVTRVRRPYILQDTVTAIPFKISETVANPNNKRIAIGLAVKAAGVAVNQNAYGYIIGFNEPMD